MKQFPQVKCPTCGRRGDWLAGAWGPFCSRRCKLVDLGKWLNEEHAFCEPLRPEQLAAIGWQGGEGVEDARNLIHYYRITPDRRVVIGGGPVGLSYAGRLDGDRNEAAWQHLVRHLTWLFPSLPGVQITHRWGGPFSVTLDLTPALGYLGGHDVVYSLGCIGHGVSMSHLNAQTLRDLLLERQTDLVACPFVNRRVIPWPGEPIRITAAAAIRAYLHAEDRWHERGIIPA